MRQVATERIPCGGWYIDNATLTFDENKVLSAAGGGTGGGDYLSLDGGTMNADAIINGTEELQITTTDTGESGTVGITPQGVTLVHNTNSAADSRIRAIENSVEIMANGTTVTLNGTGVNFGGGALSNIASIGASSSEIAFENDMDMNSHKITGLADPTGTTDAMTKNYADITYQSIADMSEYVRTDDLADTSTAGIVKQAAAVADSTGATDTTLETKVNELIGALRTAGIIAPNA